MSEIRELLNKLSKRVIKNERVRKKIIVSLYNIRTLLFEKHNNENPSIFDYKKIVCNKRFICRDVYKGNFYYGISNTLLNYCGYNKKINACIEHGVYFGNYVNEYETQKSGLPAIITFSPQREKHLKNTINKILKIGPYIKYAEYCVSEEKISQLKKRFGKTLLVFPSHSVDRVNTEFDYNWLLSEIQRIKEIHNFNSVFICLYYRDIECGRAKYYEDKGYKVVCAGRREDPMFLNRLKTFIKISDMTMSNSVGTHVGYCIAEEKPHYICKQYIKYNLNSKSEKKHVTSLYNKTTVEEKKEVELVFSEYSEKITNDQMKVCNKYWGLNTFLTKKEMFNAFSSFDCK